MVNHEASVGIRAAEKLDAMQVITVACSRCKGTGGIDRHVPHQKDPDKIGCPQCEGRAAMRIVVPNDGKPVFVYPEPK